MGIVSEIIETFRDITEDPENKGVVFSGTLNKPGQFSPLTGTAGSGRDASFIGIWTAIESHEFSFSSQLKVGDRRFKCLLPLVDQAGNQFDLEINDVLVDGEMTASVVAFSTDPSRTLATVTVRG